MFAFDFILNTFQILNTFPLNVLGTYDEIASMQKVSTQIVKHILVDADIMHSKEVTEHFKMRFPTWYDRYHVQSNEQIIGDTIIRLGMTRLGPRYIVQTMRYNNWRFVASKEETFLERIA